METATTNSTVVESDDPLAELTRKYPGFKKPGYIKLEQQSRSLAAKTSHLQPLFMGNGFATHVKSTVSGSS